MTDKRDQSIVTCKVVIRVEKHAIYPGELIYLTNIIIIGQANMKLETKEN